MDISAETIATSSASVANAPSTLIPEPTVALPINGKDKRKHLVALLRGFFATPVIAALGETGVVDKLLVGHFRASDIETNINREVLTLLLRYLYSIGLLQESAPGEYSLTGAGRTAVQRSGAFSLLMSYAEYFCELPATLLGTGASPRVNRLRNVLGSGQLHSRKFFPAALSLLSSQYPTAMIDVGCGDGCFLAHAIERWPGLSVFGVDLSPTAVEATQLRLQRKGIGDPSAVAADGFDVEHWYASAPPRVRDAEGLTISLWFVAHEFSHGSQDRMVQFFSKLNQLFPRARVLLGEINRIEPAVLANDYDLSIMPEFLLFHELSGQGVLNWATWRQVILRTPYSLQAEKRFDEVHSAAGESIPASFVWLLGPK